MPQQQQQDSSTEDDLQEQAMQTSAAEVSPDSPDGPGLAEVSHVTSLDSGGQIELLVHAEAEDLSVFSSEAAEADELRALSSSSSSVGRKGVSSGAKLSSMSSSSLGGGKRGSQSGKGGSPGTALSPPTNPAVRLDGKRLREEKQEVRTEKGGGLGVSISFSLRLFVGSFGASHHQKETCIQQQCHGIWGRGRGRGGDPQEEVGRRASA